MHNYFSGNPQLKYTPENEHNISPLNYLIIHHVKISGELLYNQMDLKKPRDCIYMSRWGLGVSKASDSNPVKAANL